MKWLLLLYALASLVAFIAFGLDKHAALTGRRRIPEARLHLIELLGGFPGAFAGQAVFRHKSRKGSYRLVLSLIAAAHVALWVAWWWLAGDS